MDNIVQRVLDAAIFATAKHGDQKRKYSGVPYVTHPLAVAQMVDVAGGSGEQILAAILHDVLEDTPTTREEIAKEFGEKVATLVVELTKTTKPEDGNRATRARMERDRLANISPEAKLIKLADLLHNSSSIMREDPKFARTYVQEKMDLLPVLKDGDPKGHLYQHCWTVVNNFLGNNQ